MTRVYLACAPSFGQGIHRVVRELTTHAPATVEVVADRTAADLIIHHVVGVQNFHPDMPIDALILNARAQRHAVIQYCLRTTEQPGAWWWWDHVWSRVQVVWSYYDLPQKLREEGYDGLPAAWETHKSFYRAPLGVSHAIYADEVPTPKRFLVGTSGYVAETEYIDVWAEVCAEVGGAQFHLGPDLPCLRQTAGVAVQGITDAELGQAWASCTFVNGLRAVEGFELPAAEALCVGSIPVLFDRADHRRWFARTAVYIREGSRDAVKAQLLDLARSPNIPDTQAPRAVITWARSAFDWATICGGFWRALGV